MTHRAGSPTLPYAERDVVETLERRLEANIGVIGVRRLGRPGLECPHDKPLAQTCRRWTGPRDSADAGEIQNRENDRQDDRRHVAVVESTVTARPGTLLRNEVVVYLVGAACSTRLEEQALADLPLAG